ncbi:hypothetical protein [Streptantibioticus ferralitis]|uniref:Uncharacterized protein n=1 Tax=Streptantibioticus ferralitis TaxID=236510 RepID=A0ABT5Z1Y1_9ACTN|nr:hypothetical protein [Streptantibioticus ferralitis]MDF2257804.1 hypothetical protein [Streptantibioticus ferralitis]
MSGRHATPSEPIALPGWRFAAVLVAVGAVGPAVTLSHQAVADTHNAEPPAPVTAPDTEPSP